MDSGQRVQKFLSLLKDEGAWGSVLLHAHTEAANGYFDHDIDEC